jgi:hypothetical protein
VLAEADASRGRLPEDRQGELLRVIEDVIEDLESYTDEDPGKQGHRRPAKKNDAEKDAAADTGKASCPLLLIQARSAVDQAASVLLANVLKKRGLAPSVQPYNRTRRAALQSAQRPAAELICISCFERAHSGALTVRYLIRRWRQALPEARFLACFWRPDQQPENLDELRKKVGADFFIATSLKEAADLCCDELKPARSKSARDAHPNRSAVAG